MNVLMFVLLHEIGDFKVEYFVHSIEFERHFEWKVTVDIHSNHNMQVLYLFQFRLGKVRFQIV